MMMSEKMVHERESYVFARYLSISPIKGHGDQSMQQSRDVQSRKISTGRTTMNTNYIDPNFKNRIIIPQEAEPQSPRIPIPRFPGCTCRSRYPVFSYPGGKARLSRTICELAPPTGKVFCDVFAGRGNVTWAAVTLL